MSETNTLMIPFAEVKQMAIAVATSGLFGMKTPEQALTLMLLAQAEGMHPITAARDYDIIQGRPSKKSEAMLRDFMRAGGQVRWHALDDAKADATFIHPIGGEVRISWDLERARAAGLGGKDMWKKYPRQMLRARVVSEGIRTVFPLATGGMYADDEVRDMEPRKGAPIDVKSEPAAPAAAAVLEHSAPALEEQPAPAEAEAAPAPRMREPGEDDDDDPTDRGLTPRPAKTAAPAASPDQPAARPKVGPPTNAQLQRLFAIAEEHGWTHAQIKLYLETKYKIGSTRDLSREQYDEFVKTMQTMDYPKAVIADFGGPPRSEEV